MLSRVKLCPFKLDVCMYGQWCYVGLSGATLRYVALSRVVLCSCVIMCDRVMSRVPMCVKLR